VISKHFPISGGQSPAGSVGSVSPCRRYFVYVRLAHHILVSLTSEELLKERRLALSLLNDSPCEIPETLGKPHR
jgi:hypothetical protein